MWKFNERKQSWEYVIVDSEAGEIILKEPDKQEVVLVDVPEGQVVAKKTRKPRKKST